MIQMFLLSFTFGVAIFSASTNALALLPPQKQQHQSLSSTTSEEQLVSRRSLLVAITSAATLAGSSYSLPAMAAKTPNDLKLQEEPSSGLKWADAKTGTGQPLKAGSAVSIDYSMASTAGRFPLIYTTKESGSPYRWTLGDGSTIAGIELGILGDGNTLPPMQPGGIRRLIIPQNLGYQSLVAKGGSSKQCGPGDQGSIGPIPPDGGGAYQRWYQFYCNPRIPYQPDLVLDIKLYGKR